MRVPAIVTPSSVSVFINGKTYIARNDHPAFTTIREALKATEHDAAELVKLFDIKQAVAVRSGGKVEIKGDTVFFDGKAIHSTLTTRMINMLGEGFDITPMVKFMEKLYANPSYRSVQCLYDFLEVNNIPLTPEGNFLAYKKVRDDYLDFYTGTMRNAPGDLVKVARNEVDENPDQTCSRGLHVCAEFYLQHYHGGYGRVVICEINPAHVVAVPRDYNNAKMRVSEYLVVGEVPERDAGRYFHSSVIDPSNGFSLREGVDDSSDYYSDEDFLDYEDDFQLGLGEDVVVINAETTTKVNKVTLDINGHEVVFERDDDDDCWTATFTGIDGDTGKFTTYETDLEVAVKDFRDGVVEERTEFLVECAALDEDGKLLTETFTVLVNDEYDAKDEAVDLFTNEYPDIDYGDVRIRSVVEGDTKTVLVW